MHRGNNGNSRLESGTKEKAKHTYPYVTDQSMDPRKEVKEKVDGSDDVELVVFRHGHWSLVAVQ